MTMKGLKKIVWPVMFCFCFVSRLSAQDSTSVNFTGYVKDLQTYWFVDNPDSILTTNFIHNRINLSIEKGKHFFFNLGMRNLIYIGDQVKYVPQFEKFVVRENGFLNLTTELVSKNSLLVISTFDRLNAGWNFKNGSISIGRQRINWGINPAWNPNDIFNTYNFLNFDYTERPGTDAIRLSVTTKNQSNFDIAIAPSKNDSSWIGAVKYGFNKWGYDFQFIGGNYKMDVVTGLGFAGNIKQAGLKTEVSYFRPRDNFFAEYGDISISSGIDYGFSNGWYVNGSFLYNSAAPDQLYSVRQLTGFQLTPKVIMPMKMNFMIQTAKTFSPLFSGNFAVVYSPKINLLILLPTLSYSIASNWDLDLIIQSYFADNFNENFKTLGNTVNFRIRWSY